MNKDHKKILMEVGAIFLALVAFHVAEAWYKKRGKRALQAISGQGGPFSMWGGGGMGSQSDVDAVLCADSLVPDPLCMGGIGSGTFGGLG